MPQSMPMATVPPVADGARAVRAAGLQSMVTIQSFDWRTLRRVQERAPAIPTSR